MQLDPAITLKDTRRSSKGSDVLTIFVTTPGGGDLEIKRDCDWSYEETTEGHVIVEAKLYENFSDFACGTPNDLEEQIEDELSRLYEFKGLNIEKLIIL